MLQVELPPKHQIRECRGLQTVAPDGLEISRAFFDQNFVLIPTDSGVLVGHLDTGKQAVTWHMHRPELTGYDFPKPRSNQLVHSAGSDMPTKLFLRAVTEQSECTMGFKIDRQGHVKWWPLSSYGANPNYMSTPEGLFIITQVQQKQAVAKVNEHGVMIGDPMRFDRGNIYAIVSLSQWAANSVLLLVMDGNTATLQLHGAGGIEGLFQLKQARPLSPPLFVRDKVFCCFEDLQDTGNGGSENPCSIKAAWIPLHDDNTA